MKKLRHLGQKKNEWVLFGFIMENFGDDGQMSLSAIVNKLQAFKKHSRTTREIGQRLSMNRSKGFERVSKTQRQGISIVIWRFEGELPPIPNSTRRDWEERLSLRDNNQF